MYEKPKRHPEVRVYPHTHPRLKLMALQHNMTMQDLVEWLVAEQEKREKGDKQEKKK